MLFTVLPTSFSEGLLHLVAAHTPGVLGVMTSKDVLQHRVRGHRVLEVLVLEGSSTIRTIMLPGISGSWSTRRGTPGDPV